MTHKTPPEHFQGKSVAEHLKDAREKGATAKPETHGTEPPGHFAAGADSARDIALAFLILWSIHLSLGFDPKTYFGLLVTFTFGWIIWKTGRSALLAWARLERLHRVIEEERWEIQHHREQEKEELREMYRVKGFSGRLLDEVIDVLVADDNRLLRIMLEEELGLSLEIYEHPLKQAFGAFIWAFVVGILCLTSFYFWPLFGIPIISLLIVITASHLVAKFEKRRRLRSAVWNLALALFCATGVYFLGKLLV